MSSAPSEMLLAALEYLRLGWHPIPLCWPGEHCRCACYKGHTDPKDVGKAPLLGSGYERLTVTEALARRWWGERWPEANVGILLAPSGLVVIDLDGQAAIEEATACGLPARGPVARSGRTDGGEGRHLYCRRPEGCPVTRASHRGSCRRIEVLSAGYAVAPPSRHRSGRRYERLVSPWRDEE
ncbi:MAG: bifunctional DNA primase/polymerase [Armatimonadetes bacterium]|nr:bifunctional DNA primase/polymerase [Armatimonadota bacterium]